MTDAEADARLRQERAVFRQRSGAVDWYWLPLRRVWWAKTRSPSNFQDVSLRAVASGGCNC